MDSLYVRYASALLSLAKEEGKVKEYKSALKSLLSVFNDNPDLSKYLKSYFVKNESKYKIIDELTKDFNLLNLHSFLKLLVFKHRFNSINSIVDEFIKECNETIGIEEGYVYSTNTLSDEQMSNIEDAVSKKLDHKVELKNKIDSTLIGGIKVVVHDYVFDGSIKNKFETMKTSLNERRIN